VDTSSFSAKFWRYGGAKPHLVIAKLKSCLRINMACRGTELDNFMITVFDSKSHNPHNPLPKISYKMHISAAAGFVTLCSLLRATAAHNIQLKAHDRECFHENLHRDDKMTVTFQVGDREFGGAGNLDIDFWVGSNAARSISSILRG
jgi:hypothetical protein